MAASSKRPGARPLGDRDRGGLATGGAPERGSREMMSIRAPSLGMRRGGRGPM